jgi:hypothetical protein
MSPEENNQNIRPDPAFKEIIGQAAKIAGFHQLNVELPQLSLSDLILEKDDPNQDLSNTLFHFFREVTVVEFKSENDDFDDKNFAANIGRCFFLYSRYPELKYKQLLDLYISSEKPEALLRHLAEEKVVVKEEEEWLLTCKYGTLDIAIVICRLLPLQERYFLLLLFAPSGSITWKEFIKKLVEQERFDLINVLSRLRPKEVSKMLSEIKYEPPMTPEWIKDKLEAIEILLNTPDTNPWLQKVVRETVMRLYFPEGFLADPEVKKIFDSLPMEKVVENLPVEEVVPNLSAEKIAANLTPEQKAELKKLLAQEADQNSDQ